MAWDPNQGQEQPGNGGQPANGGPEPNPNYSAPQNPYEGQGQPGSGADPHSGYGTPQNPYGTPPPQYSTPPNQQGGYGYGSVPPQQAIGAAVNPFVNTGGFNPGVYQALIVSGSTFSFIAVPVSFFILVGIQYLIAKAFQGEGRFLTQSYTTLLYQVPIYAASYVLGLIPILGGIAGFALYIYSIVLNVFSIMAVHRLSGGKATAVVLIPIAVLLLLVFLCLIAIAAIFFAAYRSTHP